MNACTHLQRDLVTTDGVWGTNFGHKARETIGWEGNSSFHAITGFLGITGTGQCVLCALGLSIFIVIQHIPTTIIFVAGKTISDSTPASCWCRGAEHGPGAIWAAATVYNLDRRAVSLRSSSLWEVLQKHDKRHRSEQARGVELQVSSHSGWMK
jgi:hypothetical protein